MGDGSNAPPLIFWPAMALGISFWSLVLTFVILFYRRRKAVAVSCCGKCGYDVRGLPTFNCPECGSDLRQVGIRSASNSLHPLLLFLSAIAASWKRMAIITLAGIALLAVAMYLSITFILRHDVFPHSQAILDPASKEYRVILDQTGQMMCVSGTSGAQSEKIRGKTMVVQLSLANQPADHNVDFHIDLRTWACYLYHWTNGVSPTVPPTHYNRGELEKFFKEKQIDSTTPAIRAEIDSLALLIDSASEMPLHRAAASAKNFTVVSAGDKSDVQMNTTLGPPGMFFLLLGGSIWLPTMTGIVITRMVNLGKVFQPPAAAASHHADRPSSEPTSGIARTLTILFSDIKDFTARSAAAARTGAVELARRHRQAAAPIIRQRRGNLVKTIGDALLVTFDSATDAVLAGLEIQSAIAAQNSANPAEEAIQLRIAVATGEVILEAGDVYGETVNLASRLQGIAAPGDVILSAATRSLINSHEVQTVSFGAHPLAGFKLPVETFLARSVTPATTL